MLAKRAYEKSNVCFDAILFQVNLEKNSIKRIKLIDNSLKFEKKRLEKEMLDFYKKFPEGHIEMPFICFLL